MKFFNIINFNKKSSAAKNDNKISLEKSIITEHIKSGTNIKTLHVEVKKSTHKTSYINAEFADINTHKGVIEGGDIHIKQLKGGKVIANTISVDFMEDGTIEANYIHIKRLGSRNLLTATDIIEIDGVEGIKNSITIKPIFDMEKFSVLSALYEKIIFYKKEFASTVKILEKKRLEVENQLLDAQLCRAKIKLLKENGTMPDTELMVKVREFDILSRDYQKLINMSESLKSHTDIAIEEFKAHMGWSEFSRHERVICNCAWRENSKIVFALPKYNLSYNPAKGENAHEIYLWYNSELLLDAKGEFEIKINKKS
ncbi:MAG: hypothetical protein LBS26_00370 [Campylobacteraceae bacterium]|jgi:hypothetical protein|nr:hypothetical protein [Campylobacteraceae bacterium]